jgi:hypothetical protein
MSQGTASAARARFADQGFSVVPGAVPGDALRALTDGYLAMLRRQTGWDLNDPWRGEIIERFRAEPGEESRIYDDIRTTPLLRDLALSPSIASTVEDVLGGPVELLGKIVFRIDLPHSIGELAYWHQDNFYVKGDVRTVTAWIPLQDTPFERGCLGVMPGSHLDGLLDHDLVIGKRHVPRAALGREIRLAEMEAGDLLLFHSCLVHSSNLNVSDCIRYSVQARFVPLGAPVDPGMGEAIPVR